MARSVCLQAGLVDNGQGEFFKFPLTREVTDGLQGYLNTLLEADDGLEQEGQQSTDYL